MIYLRDAATLALTKIRTRRLRTLVTVLVAGVLFGCMLLATSMIQGAIDSADRFSAGSLSGRFLASASYSRQVSMVDDTIPESVLDRATEIFKRDIANKEAAAEKLGIDYDSSVEPRPTQKWYDDTVVLDSSSPAAIQAFNEYVDTLPQSEQLLDEMIQPYNPVNMYDISWSNLQDGRLKMIKDGDEHFADPIVYPNYGEADVSFGWVYMDESVTKPFTLPQEQLDRQQNTTGIPVIAPISRVEEALGLEKLPNDASATEKLERIKYIRDNAEKATFTACYRNTVSELQIKAAIDNANELKKNNGYQEPSLTYALPTDAGACAAATILKDDRTELEKESTKKQDKFASMFGQEVEPVQQKIIFRVVGLSPSGFSYDSMSGLGNLVAMIAGSTLDGQWVVPKQMLEQMTNKNDYSRVLSDYDAGQAKVYDYSSIYSRTIVEFSSVDELKEFVTKEGCGFEYCSGDKSANYFGNNSVLINDMRNQVTIYLGYIAAAVAAIATFIMMGMIGRVISDSRRETAVFRAIGACRNDIRLIYLIYTLLLSLIIVAVSLLIGLVAAVWINTAISPEASVQAHLIYIFSDDSMKFDFVGIWPQAVMAIGLLMFATGFVGMLLPLSRNLARNPIKDMRDDT